jgi:hypothetical protein
MSLFNSNDGFKIKKLETSLADVTTKLVDISYNVKHPPAPLVSAKGDGITYDSSAIQALINYVPDGSVILFPYGTYIIDACLQFNNRNNITIIGNNATLKLWSGGSYTNAYTVTPMYLYRCTNITIKGINLDCSKSNYFTGTGTAPSYDQYRGFWIVGCKNLIFENCSVKNVCGSAFKIMADGALGGIPNIVHDSVLLGIDHLKIVDCIIDTASDGIQINPSASNDIWVERNTISNIDEHGFTNYPNTINCHVINNHFINTGKNLNNGYAIRFFETVHGTIQGNYIEKCTSGISLEDNGYSVPNQYISVKNNTIIDSSQFFQTSTYAMYICGKNLEIENNNIDETTTSNKYYAVSLDGQYITFHDNKIKYTSGASASYLYIGYKTGATITGAQDLSIKDNFLSGSTPNAINVKNTGCSNINMYKNKILGYQFSAILDSGRACIFQGKKKFYRFATGAINSTSQVQVNSEEGLVYYIMNEDCFINKIHIYTDRAVAGNIGIYLYKGASLVNSGLGTMMMASVSEIKAYAYRGSTTDIFDNAYFKSGDTLILKVTSDFNFTGTVRVSIEMDVIDYKN